jgi:transcriptional regulator with GAF, ATPase, and Fis domain
VSEQPDVPSNSAEAAHIIEIAEMFSSIARTLMKPADPAATLQRIVELAVQHLDGCEWAGVTMIENRRVLSPASSNELAATLDRIQHDVDEGPCLDALREQALYRTGRLDLEARWPEFCRRALAETAVLSVLAVRLFIEEDTLGALNLYSTTADAFDDMSVALATVFATHAAIALGSSRHDAQLESKASTRDLIGRAKGILISQQHITDERAFELLRLASQRLNIKLTEVAEGVTYTGDLPD